MSDLTVANTILAQLGGNKFKVMTGAKQFIGDAKSLTFSIGRNSKSVSKVRITLTPADLYKVEFLRLRDGAVKVLAEVDGVYAENLRDVFTQHTGLYTSL